MSDPLLRETETNLSTASRSPMTTSGEAHFKFQLGNSERSYPFIVAELGMTTKAILGNNFLRDQESNIDIKLSVLDDETHLLQMEHTATCCRVRLPDSVEILPQHEMLLTGILDRPGKDTSEKQGLVQDMHNLVWETGLFMGTALVDPSKQLARISLLNSDEEPKQSPKGYTFGVMEQVERAPPMDDTVLPIPEDGPCKGPIEHLMPLLDGMSDQLEPEQQVRVLDLVLKYQGIFALPNGELCHTTLVQHTVIPAIVGPLNNLLVGCHFP